MPHADKHDQKRKCTQAYPGDAGCQLLRIEWLFEDDREILLIGRLGEPIMPIWLLRFFFPLNLIPGCESRRNGHFARVGPGWINAWWTLQMMWLFDHIAPREACQSRRT